MSKIKILEGRYTTLKKKTTTTKINESFQGYEKLDLLKLKEEIN